MTGTTTLHILTAGEGEAVDLGVARMRVLAAGGVAADSQFSLMEFSGETAGAWTVPHLHRRMLESFYILDGQFTFTIGGQTVEVGADTYLVVPRNTAHMIEAAPGGGRFLTLIVPGGLERMFLELARLPGTGLTDRATREAIASKYDSVPV